MAGPTAKYVPSERALLTELGDGTGVLLDLDSKFYFTLNETALFVWKLLVEHRGLERGALIQKLAASFEVESEQAGSDLDDVLDELTRERLLQSA